MEKFVGLQGLFLYFYSSSFLLELQNFIVNKTILSQLEQNIVVNNLNHFK